MGDLAEHFSRREFKCNCGCVYDNISLALIEQLSILRERFAQRMTINSGCRCEAHNKAVGGKPTSAHLTGEAVDISIGNSRDKYILMGCIYMPHTLFSRVGIGRDFVHVDICDGKNVPQNVLWGY